MKRATFFKSGGSISLSSSPTAEQTKDKAKEKAKDKESRASGRQSIRGRISAPIPFADTVAAAPTPKEPITAVTPEPSVPAPALEPAPVVIPASLPIASPIAIVSPLASPVIDTAPAKVNAGEHAVGVAVGDAAQAEPVQCTEQPDKCDLPECKGKPGQGGPCSLETHDTLYDADLEDADKGKAPGHEHDEEKEELKHQEYGGDEEREYVAEMANSPEPMPALHSQKQRLATMSPAGHRRVQTLDEPKQQPAATVRQPHMSQPPPLRQQQPQQQAPLGSPFRHRTNPSNTLRYSTASGASGTATSGEHTNTTADSSPKPHRKKSTLRGALSKLFGRKKMGAMHAHSFSQNPTSYHKTDGYMPTIDDHYGDYEKELERGPNHRSVRSDPTILSSMARGGESKRSASQPISEYDRALRSHSVGPDEMTAIDSERTSLAGGEKELRDNRLTTITNMSTLSHFSNLSNLSHVGSLDGGRRRAATTTRVSLYPSQSLSQPLQARRRLGNYSAEVLGGSEWTGLSPRPASAHGRGLSRLSSHSPHPNLNQSLTQNAVAPTPDLAINTSHHSHLSHLSSNSISAKHDPSEIGRAITSDGPGLEADAIAQRRRSRSLSGLAEIALDSMQARRRSDEIRYWRESYDPAYLSPLSSRHGDEDDEEEYDDDIHDEYTRPDYEGDDESEEDSDVEDDSRLSGENKANEFQQRNSLSNVIHASKLQRILQKEQQQQQLQLAQAQAAEAQPAPRQSGQEFPFASRPATAVSTRISRPVSSHSVKAIAILSAQAANSMNGSSSAADADKDKDKNDARIGGLETRMNRMESVVDQLCHSVPGFKGVGVSVSVQQQPPQTPERSGPAPTSSPYAAFVQNQPAIPPIPAIYQSQVAPVQSSQSQYSVSRRSFDLENDDELDDGHSHMSFGETYIGSIPPSSSATQAPSMLVTSNNFFSQAMSSPQNQQQHRLVHHESTASLQTANLLAQLESERAVRQTLETQVKKLNERVNMLSTTMYAMLRDPAAAAAASKSVAVKSSPSPQSPRRSPSSASMAASIAAAQLKADTVIQTAKALGHGRDYASNNHSSNNSTPNAFSVESGGITPKGFIHDTSPSEYYYGGLNHDLDTENNENEDPIHDSDTKRRKAARTLSLGQLTLGKSAVQP